MPDYTGIEYTIALYICPLLVTAPHPDQQVSEKLNLTKTLTDPGTWAILGLGAAFLVLQFMRYRSSASPTRTADLEELDFKEPTSEEPDASIALDL